METSPLLKRQTEKKHPNNKTTVPFCSAAACPEYLNGLKHLNSWLVFCIRSYYYWQQFLEPQGQGSILPNAGCRTKSYGMGTVKNKAWGQRLGFGGAGAAAARLLPSHPQPRFASWRRSHPLLPRMGFPFPPRCSLSNTPVLLPSLVCCSCPQKQGCLSTGFSISPHDR